MSSLNINRVAQLLKIDLVTHQKTILILSAALIVVFALLPFHITGNSTAYFLVLYLVGFSITGRAFVEMHNPRRAFQYLTLPCSNLERFFEKWLLTTVIFTIGTLVIFYFFSVLSLIVNHLIYHRSVSLFNLTNPDLWGGIGKYIILQSVVLLGASYFKKNALTKTILVVGCLLLTISIAIFFFSWIFCPSCSFGSVFELISISWCGSYFIFWIILAPFCWYVTYLRVSDSEIK